MKESEVEFDFVVHAGVTNHSVAKDSAEETNIWKAPGFWISVGVAVAVLGLQAMRVWPIPRTR